MNKKNLSFFCVIQATAALLVLNVAAAEKMPDADNTSRNERDRAHAEVTPRDQSNRPEDIAITKSIRQSIIADKSLSLDAHNIKVITVDGRVTLRGPVKTEEEKQIISTLAAKIASPDNVENQLEVKLSK